MKKGQIEFLNGGWCSNDEATTYYEDIIEQMTLGHDFLKNEFDYIPKVFHYINIRVDGKLIHLVIQMEWLLCIVKWDWVLFSWLEWILKTKYLSLSNFKFKRISNKELEFIWKPNNRDSVFAHIFFNHYD